MFICILGWRVNMKSFSLAQATRKLFSCLPSKKNDEQCKIAAVPLKKIIGSIEF